MSKHQAVWDDTRHTLGMEEMDSTHREFIEQVAALIAAGNAEFPALFQALVNHTAAHFKAEGVLMRASKYRGLPEHEGEHHRVLGELQQLNRSLKRGHLPLVRAYVKEGLPEWFDTHLAMMDGALVMHLKKVGGKCEDSTGHPSP
ncbi:hemerythrin domain-containing protein [Sideroxydans sp. CL21]|uniref:bacteriohemerythrin n=1 Tax=Sideroxydans sp. CL21 TaxID=2600596 RepID=UPI0024BD2D5B|nr:hemerythrin domain-containing protein [Sideroxydans sp. CL21]